ncbi:hypothetical protein B0H13DRAFT_1876164 [Mycena leptocephala]|nr:hypothetical protein B0H13DRAFT_1876164 [Mycena leptocephala]
MSAKTGDRAARMAALTSLFARYVHWTSAARGMLAKISSSEGGGKWGERNEVKMLTLNPDPSINAPPIVVTSRGSLADPGWATGKEMPSTLLYASGKKKPVKKTIKRPFSDRTREGLVVACRWTGPLRSRCRRRLRVVREKRTKIAPGNVQHRRTPRRGKKIKWKPWVFIRGRLFLWFWFPIEFRCLMARSRLDACGGRGCAVRAAAVARACAVSKVSRQIILPSPRLVLNGTYLLHPFPEEHGIVLEQPPSTFIHSRGDQREKGKVRRNQMNRSLVSEGAGLSGDGSAAGIRNRVVLEVGDLRMWLSVKWICVGTTGSRRYRGPKAFSAAIHGHVS